jgi:alkylhydroperoxidase family enzyme
MTRDDERLQRANQLPIVGGLPDVPGIGAAMGLSPALGVHLRGLADALLVDDFPGATLRRAEREMIAAATSAGNDCFFCMDSHAAFATELLDRDGDEARKPLVDELLVGALDGFDPKMRALLTIAGVVRHDPLELTAEHVAAATSAGATDGDVQLAVCIASAFSMYNRLVDGLRTMTPPTRDAYGESAQRIADQGYSRPPQPSAAPTA